MSELYRSDCLVVLQEGDTLSFTWTREDPSDDHAVASAKRVEDILRAVVASEPRRRYRVLIDLGPSTKAYPRATAAYTSIIVGYRDVIHRGALVSKNPLLRAAASVVFLTPGLSMKTFSDAAKAKAYVADVGWDRFSAKKPAF